MKHTMATMQTRLTVIGVVVLFLGFGSAVFIYQEAGQDPRQTVAYEQSGSSFYPVNPEDSKKYQRDLEFYGGKANVLVDSLRRRLAGLLRGESLAFTIASIAILIACGLFYAAGRQASRPARHSRDTSHRDKRGADT